MPTNHGAGREIVTASVTFTGPDAPGEQVFDAKGRLERSLYVRLSHRIAAIARRYGGELHMMSWTAPSRGLPAAEIEYGASYAFEAGDVNIASFQKAVAAAFPRAVVTADPDSIMFDPHEAESAESVQTVTTEVTILVETGALEPADADEIPAYAAVDIAATPAYGPALIRSAALAVWRNTWPKAANDPAILPRAILTDDILPGIDGPPEDAIGQDLGEYTIGYEIKPDIKRDAAIPGTVTVFCAPPDSALWTFDFDAESWFEQADRQQIAALVDSLPGPSHETDAVMAWLITNGLDDLAKANSIDGDLCVEISQAKAMAWLAENRPDWGYAPAAPSTEIPAP